MTVLRTGTPAHLTGVKAYGKQTQVNGLIRREGPLRSDRWPIAPTAATFDELVGLLAAVVAGALLAWLACVVVVTALSRLPGAAGRRADAVAASITPLVVRRAARLAIGVAITAGPVAGTAPAIAGTVGSPIADPGSSDVTGGPALPGVGRPGHPSAGPSRSSGPAVDHQYGGVVVTPGDCLWRIAARTLGPNPTNAAIAAEWPRWYEANRAVIGADPDLLHPGMVLRAPATN